MSQAQSGAVIPDERGRRWKDIPSGVVDITVVNWNGGIQLRECLASIVLADEINAHVIRRVILVDNASTDGSADTLMDVPLPLIVIKNETNKGFAAACNQGAASGDAE